MTTTELKPKPCPFCGNNEIRVGNYSPDPTIDDAAECYCESCGARQKPRFGSNAREKAIREWNERFPETLLEVFAELDDPYEDGDPEETLRRFLQERRDLLPLRECQDRAVTTLRDAIDDAFTKFRNDISDAIFQARRTCEGGGA